MKITSVLRGIAKGMSYLPRAARELAAASGSTHRFVHRQLHSGKVFLGMGDENNDWIPRISGFGCLRFIAHTEPSTCRWTHER
jgi:hypothetical protein